jgi:hypothetical protein
MRWPWQRQEQAVAHPREAEWTETERQQREGMVLERRDRRAVEARVEAILREFEALADPRLVRRLNDR